MTKIDQTLYIDDRESKETQILSGIIYDNVEVTRLSVADAVFHGVAFEFKHCDDFVSSIFDKRIFIQIANMKEHYKYSFILVHGTYSQTKLIYDSRSRVHNFPGVVASIIARGITPLFTGSLNESLELIRPIAEKMTDNKVRDRPIRTTSMKDRQLGIVCSLPGVSEKRAHDLLIHFHTITNIISAPTEELTKVPGIGPKTAGKIVKLNHKTYKG